MDDELALAAMLAEAAGTTMPTEADVSEIETMVFQQQQSAGGGSAGEDTANAHSQQGAAAASNRPVPVSSAFALSLNQYMGQHPMMMQNHSKTFTIYQTCIDYPEVSDSAIQQAEQQQGGAGEELEARVRYQQWIANCQESLELERLAAVYEDPVAALNASLVRLHEMAALPKKAANAPCGSTLYFDKKELPADVTHTQWARSTLENPLARAAYYLAYGPLFRCDSVAAAMGLKRKKVIDEAPSSSLSSANNNNGESSSSFTTADTTFSGLFGPYGAIGGSGAAMHIARSEPWANASARIAQDVYDRQAWLTLLACIKGLPLHRVRHIWQAFCFYFPTCGPIIQYYLMLEINLLTNSSDGANRYGLGPEGLRVNERILSLADMNGVKDTHEQSAAEGNFKAILRIANCFARHLPLCASPSLYEQFFKFVLSYIPTDDTLLGNCMVEALLNRVGRLPTSNGLWHSFINIIQTLIRRLGSPVVWQLYIKWGAAKPGSERGIDGKPKSGADIVSKLFLRMLTSPLEGREYTNDEYTKFQQSRFGGNVGKHEKSIEISINASRESFNEGWKMWGEMYHGCYEPQMPYLRLIAIPYGGVGGGGFYNHQNSMNQPQSDTFSSLLNDSNRAADDNANSGGAIGFGAEGEGVANSLSTAAGDYLFNNGAPVVNGQHQSSRQRETPYMPIPMGHRDLGRFEAEEERITQTLSTVGVGLGGGFMSGSGADGGGGGVFGAQLRAKIDPEFRPNLDAEGLRLDIQHWQLWERIIQHERSADRLASNAASHTARVVQFLQWRVAHFPQHAVVYLDLAQFIERSPTITDRIAKAREVLENAMLILPESKILVAEFCRLLRTSLADDSRGHILFKSAVERAKTRLALFRQMPLAAPLGANYLLTKFGPLGDVATVGLRRALDELQPEDVVQHGKLLSLARAQALESLEIVQSLLTWYALWMQWAFAGFKSEGASNMRLVAQHAFGETNIVLVVIQEVQRLYKSLSLPFFVEPSRPADGVLTHTPSGEPIGPNSVLADLLAVLTTSGNSAIEADTCIYGRGAGCSIVFAPRHHFAALNALCKLWLNTEAIHCQAHENSLLIFTTWASYLRTMCENTANRYWNPLDCGVDETIFNAAHTLLACRPQDKPRVFAALSKLMSVVGKGNDDASQMPRDLAVRLYMRFDPRNEWGWGANRATGTIVAPPPPSTTDADAKRQTPAVVTPSVPHVASLAFGPLDGDVAASSFIDHAAAPSASAQQQHQNAAAASESLLLALAQRWRDSTNAFDATSIDFSPCAFAAGGQRVHCDFNLDDLLGPSTASPLSSGADSKPLATDAAVIALERALASSATIPMLTPFSHYINPRLFAESYLSVSDDLAGYGFIGGAAQIVDLDSNDNVNGGGLSEADEAAKLEAMEAQRQREMLLGVTSDPLSQSPFNWWAPSRCMHLTPRAFKGITDLVAGVPSTVPFAAQGILDLVRSHASAEHAAQLLQIQQQIAEASGSGASTQELRSKEAAMLGSILSNSNMSRGAITRADVVNNNALTAIDSSGLTQISAAMDTFALPNRLERFNLEGAMKAHAEVMRKRAAANMVTATSAASSTAVDGNEAPIAQQQQDQAAGLDAFTQSLIANALIGYDDAPEPLKGSEWISYKLPINESFIQRQRTMRQYQSRGRGGGRGGAGGRGDRGGRGGRGGRGRGWQNQNHHRRQSLLTLADEEERKSHGDGGAFESDNDDALDSRRMPAKLPEGVHAPQRTLSQFTPRTFATAPKLSLRSLEFSMDNYSLKMASQKEADEMKEEQHRKDAEEGERDRMREERDKRRRADGIYSGPKDSHAAALAAHSRQEREAAASAAQAAILAQNNGVLPSGMSSAGALSHSHYQHHHNNGGAAPPPGGFVKGLQQTPLEIATKTRRRIVAAIASRAYPMTDAWMAIPPDHEETRRSTSNARSASASVEGNSSFSTNPLAAAASSSAPPPLTTIERGNTYFAPLHYLISKLPRHTFGPAVAEAEEVTGSKQYSTDEILAILKDTPSLRIGQHHGSMGGGEGAM